MPILPHNTDLLFCQPCKAKHANLARDVVPCPGGPHLIQLLLQDLPHLDNATAHRPQVFFPISKQLLVIQDNARYLRTVDRRIGDLGSLEDGQLGGDASCGVCALRTWGGDEMEATRSLAVEAEVLSVRLCDAHLEALADKVPDGPGVS